MSQFRKGLAFFVFNLKLEIRNLNRPIKLISYYSKS